METVHKLSERRTSVDDVFDFLYDEIVKLRLRPGDRISEADIASQFGVSRQPVRDAFSRLANLDLLLIRPQRATEVRRFSPRDIDRSRFVRRAIEKEVVTLACEHCDAESAAHLDAALARQQKIVTDNDYAGFGPEDYQFHKTICHVARVDFMAEVISSEKANIDRLCMLSIYKEERMRTLLDDHTIIVEAIKVGDVETAVKALTLHLSRLDETIERIHRQHPTYFEAE